jgi:Ca-activated chloride channel homolog
MRKLIVLTFLTFLTSFSLAQLSQNQYKALNNYVDYANQSAEEVSAVVSSIIDYYPKIFEKKSWSVARYTCPIQLEEYYYNKVIAESGFAGPSSSELLKGVKALRAVAEEIDLKCKALDTYHKLEDYKTDNYARAESLVTELQSLIIQYTDRRDFLETELNRVYLKSIASPHAYAKPAQLMRKELDREKTFLNLWRFNLKEDVPTGWIVEELQKSISDTDNALKQLKPIKPVLSYPASSMWPSFQDALNSILESKRHALDEYNFEAKKSDHHQNEVYLSLINYYNGALLADYNAFIGFAANDRYTGLKAFKYVPSFEINGNVSLNEIRISPFKDIPRATIVAEKQKVPVSKAVFNSLDSYVEFINETWRQISHHRDIMRNLNSSAAYYATLTSFAGKGGLSFAHDNFNIPYSHFQKASSESRVLQPAHATSLNAGAEVLMNILKEMDGIGSALEQEVKEKKYEKDKLKHVYEMIERTHVLFETWDERKELLFEDLQKIFDAYPPAEPLNSWQVSGSALRALTKLDREGLFKARSIYKGKSTGPVPTEEIDSKLRDVIAKEFENMKGLQKYGRSNGLCPYTPYEDLPKSSKLLSEYFQELKPAKENQNSYQHPYHSMVYQYNEIVDDYNKFSELSAVPLLKYVKQPELFKVIYPDKDPDNEPPKENISPVAPTVSAKPNEKENASLPKEEKTSPVGTVQVIRDTVYIEKRDTIYLHDPAENVRSMEGYASNNMVLLLDVSGSMNSPDKLPLLKKSVMDMLAMMRTEDEISIVVFSGKPKVLLPSISFKEEAKIKKAINALKPSGKTDANAGLKLAFRVADENYMRGGNNRIVLATDGEFSLDPEIEKLVEKFSKEDILLTIFNFGNKSAMSKNLERIATLGKGNYELISKENVESKLIREAKSKRKK